MQMQAFEFLPCTLCYNCSYLPGRIVTPTKPGVNKNSIANRSNSTSISMHLVFIRVSLIDYFQGMINARGWRHALSKLAV